MHTTKTNWHGAGLVLIGVAFFYNELGIALRALAAITYFC
jgi:hypothetical protein